MVLYDGKLSEKDSTNGSENLKQQKKNGKHKKIIWLLMKKMQKKPSLFIPSRFVELMEYNVHKLWTLKVIR